MTDFPQFPEIRSVDRVNLKAGDVFVLAAGFEDRATAFAESLVSEAGAHSIVLEYLPYDKRNKTDACAEFLEAVIGVRAVNVKFNRYDPASFSDNLAVKVKSLGDIQEVYVDISGMSKLAILLTLGVFADIGASVSIVYCEASEYRPTEVEYINAKAQDDILLPSFQLYTGLEDVVRAAQLASVAMHGQPLCLVSFMSFNEKFVQALLNRLNPSRLILINGRPPAHCWRELATSWIHKNVIDEWRGDNPVGPTGLPLRSTSTFDYSETYRVLSSIYWDTFSVYRLILAPSGSKMQAVGSYLAKAVYKDIHIEYPVARGFLDEYSVGCGSRWIINFGNLREFVDCLREAEVDAALSIG